jgi:carbonic anhydrase/acetyltransferase-like protein (isoleucine patch superfamily)
VSNENESHPELRPVILPFNGVWPRIADDAFIAPGSVVVGDVEIGSQASVWFHVTVRGDVAPIRIGARTNIQDASVIHVDPGAPCEIGDDVTVGHNAIVHASVVEPGVTIGMGAIVLSNCTVGAGAVIAAGAVVPEGTVVAAGTTVMGIPARDRGPLAPERKSLLDAIAEKYTRNGAAFRQTIAEVSASDARTRE